MSIGKNILNDLKFICSLPFNRSLKKVFYIGYVGYGNLGDEALKEAIIEIFRKKILFSESNGFLIRFIRRIGLFQFDALFLGGGTLILKAERILKEISVPGFRKKISFGTGVANHIFWKNVPGKYGEISDWVKVLNDFVYISVRGPVSAQTLSGIDLRKNIQVIGDPVLYFTREIRSAKTKVKKLGVNIGTTGGGKVKDLLWGMNEDLFFSKFIDFTRTMLIDGWEIEFIPMNKVDEALIDGLLSRHELGKRIKVFRDYLSTRLTIDRMENFDIFVGQKLHAVILSYCANTPGVMVEYRPKCRDFMKSIDMDKFNIRTDEFDAVIAKGLVEEMHRDLEEIRAGTNRLCLEYKKKLIEASDSVLKVI